MKTSFLICFFLGLSLSVLGNDGSYLSHGGVIYPTQETRISLEKEVLSFKVKDKIGYVNIHFVFNNPEDSARTLLVGFQAPAPTGDIPQELGPPPFIEDFVVMQGGKMLPYSVNVTDCEDCALKPLADTTYVYEGSIYVFLFQLTFEPGLNSVNHSYNSPASSGIYNEEMYNYILTTGSKWAGGKIGHLTATFDMGPDQYFYVSESFGTDAKWSIVGSGKVTDKTYQINVNPDLKARMIRILSGYLQIETNDFRPSENIQFGDERRSSFFSLQLHYDKAKEGEIVPLWYLKLGSDEHSKTELRLLRNTIYAMHGYAFKAKDLQEYFAQFGWYIPNPNLKLEDIQLSAEEQAYISKIQAEE